MNAAQPLKMVEWKGTGSGHGPGRRELLPAAEAAAAIAAGHATGVTLVRFLAAFAAYAPGETAGFYDHVAEQLVRLHWAEPVPLRPPDGDQGAEDKAIDRPPADRMVRHATTKEIRS